MTYSSAFLFVVFPDWLELFCLADVLFDALVFACAFTDTILLVSSAEPEPVARSVTGSSRRSFLLAANSFMDPILAAAALFFLTVNLPEGSVIFDGSFFIGDFPGDFDITFGLFLDDFTEDEADTILVTPADSDSMSDVGLLDEAGDTIVTLRLLARRALGLSEGLVGDGVLFFTWCLFLTTLWKIIFSESVYRVS